VVDILKSMDRGNTLEQREVGRGLRKLFWKPINKKIFEEDEI